VFCTRAFSSCIALGQKVLHQQFIVEMTHVAFEDLFLSPVQKLTMLDGGTEKALADQIANFRLRL